MKKTLTIAALLISTTLNAHYNRLNFFNDDFWNNFNHQFQKFDHQITKLQSKYSQPVQSRKYFDKDSNAYIFEIKTQGVNKDNLNIEIANNTLNIKGWHKQTRENSQSSNAFSFAVSLPVDGDTNNITTALKDNILKIYIPKLKQPKPKVLKITIE